MPSLFLIWGIEFDPLWGYMDKEYEAKSITVRAMLSRQGTSDGHRDAESWKQLVEIIELVVNHSMYDMIGATVTSSEVS